ncbi:MAG: hypothetical protein FVQ85_03485 [Planctomycetes bacterium]|nr:hypothetical protein [Planctomycetota bacterium]
MTRNARLIVWGTFVLAVLFLAPLIHAGIDLTITDSVGAFIDSVQIMVMGPPPDIVPPTSNPMKWASATTESEPNITEGLIGYWAMDEGYGLTTNDGWVYDNDGTISTPAVPLWLPTGGPFGGALSFNGVGGGYVEDEDGENYINGLTAFTVALWIKSNLTYTDKGFIIAKDPDGNDNVLTIRYDAVGASGGGYNLIKAGITSTGGEQQLESSSDVQTTEWQHIILTWSSGNQLALYINGTLHAPSYNDPATFGVITGATKLIIGKGTKDTGQVWDGLIDDVAILNRALGSFEIAQLVGLGGASFVSDPDLLALWELDETGGMTATDSSGNGNDGTLITYTLPAWDFGQIGRALLFDNNGGYVHCGSSPDFDITSAITVSAWIKVNDFTRDWQAILTKGDSAYRLHRNWNNNYLAFHCTRQGGGILRADGTINVNDGAWHHAAGVYDGSQIYLYVDGVPDANQAASGAINTNAFPVMLGENAESIRRVWDGLIDDARIYNQALSAAEISDLANFNTSPPFDPVAHWKLDEGSGIIAQDSAPGGLHNGTLSSNARPIWQPGKMSRALFFNGSGSYVNCGNAPVFDLADEITVAAWVNIATVPVYWAGIVTHGDSSWRFSTFENQRKFHFAVTSPAMGANWVNGNTEVSPGQWHYVCGTYDGANIRLYVDGVEDPSSPVAYTGGITTSTDEVWIGGNSERPERGFYGLIDEVAIWDYALSRSQIAWLYNDGAGNFFLSPSTFYVDDDAPSDPGPGDPDLSDEEEDGSEDHPYDAIQEAILAALPGDIVIVLDGTYAGTGNNDISFMGKPITVRSQNGPDNCIIDAQGGDVGGFYFSLEERDDSVLDGFKIINIDIGINGFGAAILCDGSSPTIRNCIVQDNMLGQVGAVLCFNYSNPSIGGCTIRRNSSLNGAGIYCGYDCDPTFTNCVITDNTASLEGGGMYCGSNSMPTIRDCIIGDNNPDGVFMDTMSKAQVLGTVEIISNNLKGAGIFQIFPNATLKIVDSGISCNVTGLGTVQVPAGRECVIEDFAVVDLSDISGSNATGTVQCDGMLRVKDYANVTLSNLNVVRASFEGSAVISENVITTSTETPYGQIAARDTAVIVENVFQTSGDRYIDVDPSQFDGVILNNRILVTITEGINNTPPALFDLRGKDIFCNVLPCPPGLYQLGEIPDFDPNTWTIERWELLENAKVTLTNRFDFQPPYGANGNEEALYVKDLILGPNSFFNIGFNRVYYETLEIHPSAVIRDIPPMGFFLDGMDLDGEVEFLTRVTNNNVYGPVPRMSVERVEGLGPDPTGMVKMRNLPDLDPCSPNYLREINARAKTLLAKSNEDEILIRFKYLFETSDPNAELAVYLSDIPDLLANDDPERTQHYIKIADIPAPPSGRPGSAGSGRFGVFQMTVSTGELNFTEGMWLEVELIGPDTQLFEAAGMGFEMSNGGAAALLDDWGVEVHCDGICMDVNWDTLVSEEDFLTVIAACGLPAALDPNGTDSLVCLDGFFSSDGFIDTLDVVSWDWAVDSGDTFPLYCGVPLGESSETSGAASGSIGGSAGSASQVSLPDSLDDLLIVGKRSTSGDPYELKSKDRLYVFDNNNVCMGWSAPESDRRNIRLVRDLEGNLYQLNSGDGVIRLDTNDVIIPPGEIADVNEPRYGKPAKVYVGLKGTGENAVGRPIFDAAFDVNYVYVVPVVVEPNDPNAEPYAAAAKLQLLPEESPPYRLVQLYDDTPSENDKPYRNNLREIELDAAGNVYVVNAHSLNECDTLWKYEPNGTVIQSLNLGNSGGAVYIPDPLGLCVSNTTEMLYLASGQYNPADVNSTVVYGISLENLTLERTITIGGMQHVSGITEEPASGVLWIAGFNMESFPEWPDPTKAPFYRPSLAEVPYDSNAVQAVRAVSIYDPNSHDLALPMSIVWTRPVKCGGADLDGDGDVTFTDFGVLSLAWLTELGDSDWNSYCNISEPADAFIDTRDLLAFVKYWLETGCL